VSVFLSLVQLLQKWANTDEEYRKDVLSLFTHDPEARLLDLGCGDGEFTLKVAEKIGTRIIFGLDGGGEDVESAKKKGIICLQTNLEARFPFEDKSFDVVCANQVIEHLSNTDGFISEIHRVLKPAGYAVISTPNLAAWHSIFFLLIGWQPHLADVSDAFFWAGRPHTPREEALAETMPHHRRLFVSGALKELFQYHGFKPERSVVSGCRPLPGPLARIAVRFLKRHADVITMSVRKN
jgi:SAM-dependent methyltransferase